MPFVQPSRASAPDAEVRIRARLAAAAVTIGAFLLYHATLLPGVDLGDSGSIQTTAGEALLSPRDGYPLYFAVGALMLKVLPGDAAHVMNLTSALQGALACGLFVLVATELTGSVFAAVGGALLFGVSYTFWSQCVTAEVYALHIAFLLGSLLLVLRWERQPVAGRLAAFFCCYALGFGNHLSMVLLLPGFAAFLLVTAAGKWRSLLAPKIVGLALLSAAAGAAQYLWNMRALWFRPDSPPTIWMALRTFWFDVTKADWRATMVMNVPEAMLRDHLRMYWFDLEQQFGRLAIVAACIGLVAIASRSWRRALLVALLFLANVIFAFGYNVGDAHVFYLPSHVMVAFCVTAAVAWTSRATSGRWAAVLPLVLVIYAGARLYRDLPVQDRSRDWRSDGLFERFTRDIDDQRNVLLVDLNWQVANGLSYVTKCVRPDIAAARMRDVLLYAPALIRDNLAAGRDVVLTERAANIYQESYGRLFHPVRDTRVPVATLREIVGRLQPGVRYVLCVLKPTREFRIDAADLQTALASLTASTVASPERQYWAITGVSGSRPALVRQADVPFTTRLDVAGVPTEIRMESWLAADTIRRMGFGHVVANHHHTLIVERGISFVAFDEQGRPLTTAYFANIYAELPRFVIR